MIKTNAMRLLDQANISYRMSQYDYDENDLSGLHAAEAIGMPPEPVFKTLVTKSNTNSVAVFCIAVCCTLDLKLAANALGSKSITMVPMKDLLPLTGYIRGGCSPVGMKKAYVTFIDETAELYEEIAISAGVRGQQIILSPEDLIQFAKMTVSNLTQ